MTDLMTKRWQWFVGAFELTTGNDKRWQWFVGGTKPRPKRK